VLDGTYRATQAFLDCGFYNDQIIWAQTAINTIEFIRLEDATLIFIIDKFDHDIDYVIGQQVSTDNRMLIYTGNN